MQETSEDDLRGLPTGETGEIKVRKDSTTT